MKKFYYLLAGIAMVLVTIIACEKASIEVEELQAVQNEELLLSKGDQVTSAKKLPKVDICHYDADLDEYFSINISENALPAHMAHGDKHTYSPLGEIYFYYETGGILKGLHFMEITTWDDSTFTGLGENRNNNSPGYYGRISQITATIVDLETMRFEGTFTYKDYGGSYNFNGYIDECGGIILDHETGDFYGPVMMPTDPEDDGWLNEPIPTE